MWSKTLLSAQMEWFLNMIIAKLNVVDGQSTNKSTRKRLMHNVMLDLLLRSGCTQVEKNRRISNHLLSKFLAVRFAIGTTIDRKFSKRKFGPEEIS